MAGEFLRKQIPRAPQKARFALGMTPRFFLTGRVKLGAVEAEVEVEEAGDVFDGVFVVLLDGLGELGPGDEVGMSAEDDVFFVGELPSGEGAFRNPATMLHLGEL